MLDGVAQSPFINFSYQPKNPIKYPSFRVLTNFVHAKVHISSLCISFQYRFPVLEKCEGAPVKTAFAYRFPNVCSGKVDSYSKKFHTHTHKHTRSFLARMFCKDNKSLGATNIKLFLVLTKRAKKQVTGNIDTSFLKTLCEAYQRH